MNCSQNDLISVVIPVYNGSRFIQRTVTLLQRQTHNIEIILVENGSQDDSYEVCLNLSKKYKNVRAFHNDCSGTSLARKRGVEEASGAYITFSDQDDQYISQNSIHSMYAAICEDQSDICQFGYYKYYCAGIRLRQNQQKENRIFQREEFLQHQVSGILGGDYTMFDTMVWSKIYRAPVLKDAVKNIHIPLFFAEDQYLNIRAFFSDDVQTISVRNECHYVWNVGVGFSSSANSDQILFSEYAHLKSLCIEQCRKHHVAEDIIFKCHRETLYFHRAIIYGMIQNNCPRESVLDSITKMQDYRFVRDAKAYCSAFPEKMTDDFLHFASDDYTADTYYDYCVRHVPKHTWKTSLRKLIRKLRLH